MPKNHLYSSEMSEKFMKQIEYCHKMLKFMISKNLVWNGNSPEYKAATQTMYFVEMVKTIKHTFMNFAMAGGIVWTIYI